jgi:hypothetical protein
VCHQRAGLIIDCIDEKRKGSFIGAKRPFNLQNCAFVLFLASRYIDVAYCGPTFKYKAIEQSKGNTRHNLGDKRLTVVKQTL